MANSVTTAPSSPRSLFSRGLAGESRETVPQPVSSSAMTRLLAEREHPLAGALDSGYATSAQRRTASSPTLLWTATVLLAVTVAELVVAILVLA
ncbi:MAG: hypothetical protein JWP66_1921 [Naasia sp.]|nr:hypothetical protein [Naasia sp.]